MKKYQIIYADPPWAYRNMGNIQATANAHYQTMSNELEFCGDIPRIELFAREKTEGWDAIGYDIDGLDLRESLLKLSNEKGN